MLRIMPLYKKLQKKRSPIESIKFGGFIPTSISGCVLWLRTDLGVVKDGLDRVSEWQDQSGNGNHISQGTDAKKPTWTDAQLNGYPALRFDGIDDSLQSLVMVLSDPYSVFLVYKNRLIGAIGVNDTIFSQPSWINGYYQSTHVSYHNFMYDGPAFPLDSIPYIANNIFAVVCCKFNAATSELYENGALFAAGLLNGIAGSGFTLASQAGSGRPSFIDAVEVVIYDSAISLPNRQLVETYLNGRYAIY